MIVRRVFPILLLSIACLTAGCTKSYPIASVEALEGTKYSVGDTTYLEVNTPITGFNGPTALLIGKDNLLYVADSKNNRVVMLNVGGEYLGERQILQPSALGQDFRLDLLVGGTIVTSGGDTAGAVFRIHLVQALHQFQNAVIDTIWREYAHPARRFVGIATMPDNTYLLARVGPDNSSFIDPDTRILLFSDQDQFTTPVTDLTTGTGSGINYINMLTDLIAFPNSHDIIILQNSIGVAYGAIWMVYQQSAEFEGWMPKFDPTNITQGSVDFIRPYRYVLPTGVAIDNTRLDIFIVDAAQDSVFKFNSKGAFKPESFGAYGTGGRMKRPTGAAFFDKTLYISDSQMNCIFTFKLSTDLQ
ncbi:MAG TPA: hypothetical protein VMM57_11660 [Bacteroidota bacterium]|nr:hypothetical protein [Bacteroidota bacterium]